MYREDLALNNQQFLICNKTKPNQINVVITYVFLSFIYLFLSFIYLYFYIYIFWIIIQILTMICFKI